MKKLEQHKEHCGNIGHSSQDVIGQPMNSLLNLAGVVDDVVGEQDEEEVEIVGIRILDQMED